MKELTMAEYLDRLEKDTNPLEHALQLAINDYGDDFIRDFIYSDYIDDNQEEVDRLDSRLKEADEIIDMIFFAEASEMKTMKFIKKIQAMANKYR
jgi:Ran GTPase-activating protein (RanGAP) involved in mRNA processing and transport